MPFGDANIFETSNISVSIPKNSLYTDICFQYERTESDTFFSDFHQIHCEFTPLHRWIDVGIKTTKPFRDSSKLYAARVNSRGVNQNVHVGKYEDGFFTFRTRDFGRYVIKVDTIPPRITPVNISNFGRNPRLIFTITDTLTGIDSFNGFINGEWVLFEHDAKTNRIFYRLNANEIGRNKRHQLKLVVKDAVGNESVFEHSFFW